MNSGNVERALGMLQTRSRGEIRKSGALVKLFEDFPGRGTVYFLKVQALKKRFVYV